MTVPGHPRTSETLVRTRLPALTSQLPQRYHSLHLYFNHPAHLFPDTAVISTMRIWLQHQTPDWVEYPEFFITICTRPRNQNQLCHITIAPLILQSAENYHLTHRWHCTLILLMPDHLHALIQVPERYKLTQVIGSWKAYLAKNLGICWHRGFFDHRIRRAESLSEKCNYIEMNPVRSGFVKNPKDWPYRWSSERYG